MVRSKKVCYMAIFLLFSGLYIFRVLHVRSEFSDRTCVVFYGKEETITDCGLEISVEKFEKISADELLSTCVQNRNVSFTVPDEGHWYYMTTLSYFNSTESAIKYKAEMASFQTKYWFSGMVSQWSYALGNPGNFTIEPEEKREYTYVLDIPYGVYGDLISGYDLYLSFYLSKEKKTILLLRADEYPEATMV